MAIVAPSNEFMVGLCEVLGIDPNTTHRIILDIKAGYNPIVVYVEQFGTEQIYDVDWGRGLEGAEIVERKGK